MALKLANIMKTSKEMLSRELDKKKSIKKYSLCNKYRVICFLEVTDFLPNFILKFF